MYRKALLRLSGNQNKPNRAERFVAGALAGQHATFVAQKVTAPVHARGCTCLLAAYGFGQLDVFLGQCIQACPVTYR